MKPSHIGSLRSVEKVSLRTAPVPFEAEKRLLRRSCQHNPQCDSEWVGRATFPSSLADAVYHPVRISLLSFAFAFANVFLSMTIIMGAVSDGG